MPQNKDIEKYTRYKGQFIQGNQKHIKPQKKNDTVFFDSKLQVGNNLNGWIPPRKGAL